MKVSYYVENFPWVGPSDNIVFAEGAHNGSSIDFWANMSRA
jgi:hypothetical protein